MSEEEPDDEFDRLDDELEAQLEERLAGLAQRGVDRQFERLTAGWTAAPDQPCPMPGERHPYYADKDWLADWLDGVGPYADRHHLLLLKPMPVAAYIALDQAHPISAVAPGYYQLTRMRCGGPAPYVGRPFVYEWFAAVDDLGRTLAGQARIVYLPYDPTAAW